MNSGSKQSGKISSTAEPFNFKGHVAAMNAAKKDKATTRSNKKHKATDDNAKTAGDGQSRSKRARRSIEKGAVNNGSASSPPPAQGQDNGPWLSSPPSDPSRHTSVTQNRVVLSPEKFARKHAPPLPAPPSSPPPQPSRAMKFAFIGPSQENRMALIQSFVQRGGDADIWGQKKKSAADSPANGVAGPAVASSWSMDYSENEKDYSYQNSHGHVSTVRLQLYDVNVQSTSDSSKQEPPEDWRSLCSTFDHAVLVLSAPELLSASNTLAKTIGEWKAWMDRQCAPPPARRGRYPMSLLLLTTTNTQTDDKTSNNSPLDSTHPALLIRFGAELESACRHCGFLKWYMLSCDKKNNATEGESDGITARIDGIVQSLVESTPPSCASSSSEATSPLTTSAAAARRSEQSTTPNSLRRSKATATIANAAAASAKKAAPS